MTSIHANCILIGNKALLIKGGSGSGKSHLCWQLLNDKTLFAKLIADDRMLLTVHNNRLIAEAPYTIKGNIELRCKGIMPVDFEAKAQIGYVLELDVKHAPRLPLIETIVIQGVALPFSQLPPLFDSFNYVKSLINLDLLH